MAIQVSGTTVINDSRQLQNIASLDATTTATIGAAAGGSAVLSSWDPTSPDTTFSSSGTWTKPSGYSDSTVVVFYLVGGGAAGAKYYGGRGGSGGNASVITGSLGDLPSSVSVVVGSGGAGRSSNGAGAPAGGDTTITASGQTFTAKGGTIVGDDTPDTNVTPDILLVDITNPFSLIVPNITTCRAGDRGHLGPSVNGVSSGRYSTFGGGCGGNCNPNGNAAGGLSTYAGNGGQGIYGSSNGVAGSAPGGGGGGQYINQSGSSGSGASGSVRVYYV